jgi:hypothetical protein
LAGVIISFSATIAAPVVGCVSALRLTRPRIASESGRSISSPLYMIPLLTPCVVPQSCMVMTTFWATSASLRVRYPLSAVFSAVSASPFRAPCVLEKYSSTVRPSRKFDLIGVSMMAPLGLAIRPRMPANWRICSTPPRAPEWAIRKIGLRYGTTFPVTWSCRRSFWRSVIIFLVILSRASIHRSITLL